MEGQEEEKVENNATEEQKEKVENDVWYNVIWDWVVEKIAERWNDHKKRWNLFVYLVTAILVVYNFISNVIVYCTIEEALPSSRFAVIYLIFLINAGAWCVWPRLMPDSTNPLSVIDQLFLAFGINLPFRFNNDEFRLGFSIVMQDAPCAAIVFCAMLFGNNCGFLISLTYAKITKASLILTLLNNLKNLATFTYDLFLTYVFVQEEEFSFKEKLKMTGFVFLCLLVPPLLIIQLVLIQFRANCFIIIFGMISLFVMVLPTYLAFFNVYFIFNMGSLAHLSGCNPFQLELSAVTVVQVCKEDQLVDTSKIFNWKLTGDKMLSTNFALLNTSCDNILYPEYLQNVMYLSPTYDHCEFWMSFSYSTDTFEPSFNYAIQLYGNNRSICVKPVVKPSIAVQFQLPLESIQIMAQNFCNETHNQTFTQCGHKNNKLCVDCTNHCYTGPTDSVHTFEGFKAILSINGMKRSIFYNSQLATVCDVVGDLKSVKYLCY